MIFIQLIQKNVWRNPIVLIIIPTYNEKENIENIIRAVFGLEKFFHILILKITHQTARQLLSVNCKQNSPTVFSWLSVKVN